MKRTGIAKMTDVAEMNFSAAQAVGFALGVLLPKLLALPAPMTPEAILGVLEREIQAIKNAPATGATKHIVEELFIGNMILGVKAGLGHFHH